MRCYAVIDTNVLVSALLAKREDSATVKVIHKLFDGTVVPVFSSKILAEYYEVLYRPKFKFNPESVESFLSEFSRIGFCIEPTGTGIVLPDEKDVPFYEVAMASETADTYLVTGNIKHFPQEPFIVTPAEFIAILEA